VTGDPGILAWFLVDQPTVLILLANIIDIHKSLITTIIPPNDMSRLFILDNI